jgi:hypothetical protein
MVGATELDRIKFRTLHQFPAKTMSSRRRGHGKRSDVSPSRPDVSEQTGFNVASRGFNMKILETERPSDKLVLIKKVVVAVDLTKHSEATAHYAAGSSRVERVAKQES